MPRRNSSGSSNNGIDELDMAGARSIERAFGEAADIDQRNLAAQREARMAQSQALNDEVQKWQFEKAKALDANAAALRKEVDQEAIVANKELRAIKANDPNADEQYAKWEETHFRVLHPKIGDERVREQWKLNQELRNDFKASAAKAAEIKSAREAKEAEARARAAELKANADATRKEVVASGLVPSGASVGDDGKLRTTYTNPGGTTKVPPVTEINSRLKAEFGVELSELQNPAAKMRRVDPSRPITKQQPSQGDESGSHYAFDIPLKEGSEKVRTVMIPINRFKAYADEYAAATGAQPSKTATPAPQVATTAPAAAQPVAATPAPAAASATPIPNQAAIDWLKSNPNDPRAPAVRAKLGIK